MSVSFSTNWNYQKTCLKNSNNSSFLQLQSSERKAIIFLLLVEGYPFIFDLVNILTRTLRVQPSVNSAYISSQLASLYGSNRAVFNAMNAALPMLIELGVYQRLKIGLYSLGSAFEVYHVGVLGYFRRDGDWDGVLEGYCVRGL